MKYLITLGCSWTWGAGAGYQEGMSKDEYKSIVWDENLADQLSFRSLLAKKYNYKNINFSIWKSSNQKQFRIAKRFFSSEYFKKIKKDADEILVLWGITSTGRNEVYSTVENQYVNFLLAHPHHKTDTERKLSEFFFENIYDHDQSVFELSQDITHWNDYFSFMNIKNYWFDSFNHHDYTVNSPGLKKFSDNKNYINTSNISNLVINHPHARDLLSQLALRNGMNELDNNYHSSAWVADTNRLDFLIEKKLINPYSFHPTKLGHEQIANMFDYIFKGE
jgi:hypothetical protein